MKKLRTTLLLALTWMTPIAWAADAPPPMDPMAELVDLFKNDAKRADAAQAVINYEAQRVYDANAARRDELLNQAPGTASFTASGTQLNVLQKPENMKLNLGPNMLNWLSVTPDPTAFAKTYLESVNDLGKVGVQDFLSNTSPVEDQAKASTLFAQMFMSNIVVPTIGSDVSAEVGKNLGLITNASPAVASMSHMHDMRQAPADGKGLSQMGTLEREAQYRFLDNIPGHEGEWAAELAVTPEPGLLRELAQMQALRLYLEQENYKNTERIESLLAASNSIGTQAIPLMNSFGPMLQKMQQQLEAIQADMKKAKEDADKKSDSGSGSDSDDAAAKGKAALGVGG